MINTILYLFYLFLIYIALKKVSFFKNSTLSIYFLVLFLGLKIVSSFLMYALYSYYYQDRSTADIFKYFDDANILYSQLFLKHPIEYIKLILGIQQESHLIYESLQQTNFWYKPREFNIYNDNRTIIRLNMIIRMFSNNCYHIHSLVITFISFIGVVSIHKTFLFFFNKSSSLVACSIFLIPSVIFWSSANLKEGLLIGAIGIFIWMFTQFLHLKNTINRNIILVNTLIISSSMLAVIKPYILIVSIPSIIAWSIVKITSTKKTFLIFVISHLLFIISGLTIHKVIPSINIVQNITFKNNDFINVANDTKAGSSFSINKLDGSITSIVKNTFHAFINNFIRPFPTECNSMLVTLTCIENYTIILLIILSLYCLIKYKKSLHPIQFYSFFMTLLLGILIGLIVPVFGASVRYKIPYLPFLIPSLMLLLSKSTQKIICKK